MRRGTEYTLWLLAAVLLLYSGCGTNRQAATSETGTRVAVVTPRQGTLFEETNFYGTANAIDRAQVDAPVAGIVTRISVLPGDRVTAGQPLFWIESTVAESKITEQKAAVEAARSRVLSLTTSVELAEKKAAHGIEEAEQSVRQSMINLNQEKLELLAAQQDQADKELLFKKGAIAFKQVRTARLQTHREEASLQLQRSKLLAAQLDLKAQRASASDEVEEQRTALASARANLDQSIAALASLEVNLSRTVVRAPISGLVVGRDVSEGQLVGASKSGLITVVDTGSYRVTGTVDQRYAVVINSDTLIRATSDIYSGILLTGHLDKIIDNPDPRADSVRIRIKIDDAEKYLVEGAKVKVRLKIPYVGWILPRSALFRDGMKCKIKVVKNNKVEVRLIYPSYIGPNSFVTKNGVNGDDDVVQDQTLELQDGQPVSSEHRENPSSSQD